METDKGLQVGGSLYLRGTQITSLPEKIKEIAFTDLCKWEIKIVKDKFKIGCQWDTIENWDLFFKNKNFFSTDTKIYPTEYQEIIDGFEKAKVLHSKYFK